MVVVVFCLFLVLVACLSGFQESPLAMCHLFWVALAVQKANNGISIGFKAGETIMTISSLWRAWMFGLPWLNATQMSFLRIY